MKHKELKEKACYRCNKRAGMRKDKKLRCCFKCKPAVLKELAQEARTTNPVGSSMLKNQWRHSKSVYLTQSDISKYFGLTKEVMKKGSVSRVIKEATRLAHTANLLIDLLDGR